MRGREMSTTKQDYKKNTISAIRSYICCVKHEGSTMRLKQCGRARDEQVHACSSCSKDNTTVA